MNVPVTTASATDASENKLVAGDGVKAYNNEGNSYYYLASDQFHLANAGILQTGKAYLEVAGATAPQLSIVFGDSQTTGINAVNGEGLKVQGSEVYNLNGQRVLNPTKGLYIVNGRKVVIKWEKNWASSSSSERERARAKLKVVLKWDHRLKRFNRIIINDHELIELSE